MRNITLSFLLASMLALTGCAPKGQPLPSPEAAIQDSEQEAARRWQAFTAHSSSSCGPISGSLRFGTADETQRVTFLLWSGEAENESDAKSKERIIRLDISAGLGSTVGSMLFKDGRMLLVIPSERRAYVGEASRDNLRRMLGLSLPLGVQELNDFLAGRLFSALDSPVPAGYETLEGDGIVYHYRKDGASVELELDRNALPVRWEDPLGWKLDITCDDKGLPVKLSGRADSVSGQQRLVLLVKERASGEHAASLDLAVPAGFAVYSLDQ